MDDGSIVDADFGSKPRLPDLVDESSIYYQTILYPNHSILLLEFAVSDILLLLHVEAIQNDLLVVLTFGLL